MGGEPTDISEHPWQVAIEIKVGYAGGPVIRPAIGADSGPLFEGARQPNDLRAKAGVNDIINEGVWADADRVIVHEGYNPTTYDDDIALSG